MLLNREVPWESRCLGQNLVRQFRGFRVVLSFDRFPLEMEFCRTEEKDYDIRRRDAPSLLNHSFPSLNNCNKPRSREGNTRPGAASTKNKFTLLDIISDLTPFALNVYILHFILNILFLVRKVVVPSGLKRPHH